MFNNKKWPKVKLGEFCTIHTGNTPPRINKDYYGDYIEWIKSDDILEYQISPKKSRECLSKIGASIGRIAKKDTILMTCIAGSIKSIGNVCLLDREVSYNQQINSIRANDDTNPMFLYALLKNSNEQIHRATASMLKYIINKSVLEKIEVIKPPIKLQNEFAEIMIEIEKQKEKQRKTSVEIDTLFSSILDKISN
jgi:type I restriction enzyme S subunit